MKVRIRVRSHEASEIYVKISQLRQALKNTPWLKETSARYVSKTHLYTLLRSPHIHKTSRVQLEQEEYGATMQLHVLVSRRYRAPLVSEVESWADYQGFAIAVSYTSRL